MKKNLLRHFNRNHMTLPESFSSAVFNHNGTKSTSSEHAELCILTSPVSTHAQRIQQQYQAEQLYNRALAYNIPLGYWNFSDCRNEHKIKQTPRYLENLAIF